MIDVVAIVLSCVMAIHMGLIDAVLSVYNLGDRNIPVIRCPKCLTFHSVLWYWVFTGHNILYTIAVAFIASYIAIWADLLLGLMDVLYENIYRKISEGGDTEVHH